MIHKLFIAIVLLVFCQTDVWAENSSPIPSKQTDSLVLLSGLDFERLEINLASIYQSIYEQTGVKIVLHSSDAEEALALKSFIKATNMPLDAVILPGDQLASIQNQLVDLSAYQDTLSSVQHLVNNNAITIHEGFYLVLFYNSSLINTLVNDFDDFDNQQLGINFATAFSTQVFWNHFDVISTNGTIKADNLESKLSDALYRYTQLLAQNTILATCVENACINERFLNQTMPYAIDGTWMTKTFKKALGENLGIASLPSVQGSQTKAVRIPHVLGVLEPLSTPQQLALRLLTEALRQNISTFQQEILPELASNTELNRRSYIPDNYMFFGCLFKKLNPVMPQLVELSQYSDITRMVSKMNVSECL